MKKVWSIAGAVVVTAVVLTLLAVWAVPKLFPNTGESAEARDEKVVRSITQEEKVILLSLGIQGIAEERVKSEVLGVDVPGSERALFLQYSYTALLGVDGADVRIAPAGEGKYLITVPEFSHLGQTDLGVKIAVERNGVLSWLTPEIDKVAVINKVLNESTKAEHITTNRKLLEDQCRTFYTRIIKAVDPTLEVEFVFTQT
ncbi:hypothetical protein [Aestuariimicrobium ganziense]|uniref:hypothetical protein n=1 Tax=Aestuariimicrobium ganziense TaxID=2773677 RepID=UPI0019457C7E|nr:hypothetical protein [Aestuariimicrobium ganziense]